MAGVQGTVEMSKDKPLSLVVITPERKVLEIAAERVVIPAHDGELGVLHLRAPLMCELGIGQLRYAANGQPQRMFIDGGFAQVLDDRVIVLTPTALPADEISAETISQAEATARDTTGTDPDATAVRERAQQKLAALRKLAGRG